MFWEAFPWFQLLESEQWKRVKFTSFTCCAVTALLAPSWKRCHAGAELPALTAGPQQGWGAGTQLALPGRELTKVVGMHRHHQSLLEKRLFGEESRVWGKSYFCNWSLHLNSIIIVFKITQNFILFAQSPVKIMWHLGTVFGKWEMLLSRHVDVPVCLWPNEWELKWKITASIAVWMSGLFSCFPALFQIFLVIVFVGPESSILSYKAAAPTASVFWIAGIWLLLWFYHCLSDWEVLSSKTISSHFSSLQSTEQGF